MKVTKKSKRITMCVYVFFALVILGVSLGLTARNGAYSSDILEESIKGQLLSTGKAAMDHIEVDAFEKYVSLDYFFNGDAKDEYFEDGKSYKEHLITDYVDTVTALTALADEVGAKIIYTVIKVGNEYRFVYDTDDRNFTYSDDVKDKDTGEIIEDGMCPFDEYIDMPEVFYTVFSTGQPIADIKNVVDIYGSWNTCIMPIKKGNEVIGVLAIDIEDKYYSKNEANFVATMWILGALLVAILATLGVFLMMLLNKVYKIQEQLKRMANYDKLTELPNRRYLLEHLGEMTAKKKHPFALYFIDLDNFKKVNDNAGHDAGDALLQHIALYLQSAHENSTVFRPGAGALNVAARVGGDEFILTVPNVTNEEEAAAFAKELLANFSDSNIDKYIDKYEVGLSIGVALYPEHSENFHVLIKYADIAMYHAKRAGKNCYRVYNDDLRNKEDK